MNLHMFVYVVTIEVKSKQVFRLPGDFDLMGIG